MQRVGIRENAVTVELDWADVTYLAHIIRSAVRHDFGSSTREPTMLGTYAETVEAFLLAAGMASWAQTVDEANYTLECFAEVVPVTEEEQARWRARVAAAQREMGRPAEGKDGEAEREKPPAA